MLSRRIGWTIAVCAVLANFVSIMDRQTMAAISPLVRKGLDMSQSTYGWLSAAFAAAYLVAAPFVGKGLDRYGARRGLVVCVLVWSCASGLHAIAPTFGVLLAFRIVLGSAESGAIPGASQAIARVLPPRDRSRALGLLFVGASLGASVVAPLSTAIARNAGWQYAFLGTAALGVLWIPLWILVTRRKDIALALDTPPAAATPATKPSAVATFRKPIVLGGFLVFLFVSVAVAFSSAWSAEMLVTDFHVKAEDVGGYLWLSPLGIDAGAVLFGDLYARLANNRQGRPDRLLLVASVAFVAGGAFTIASAGGPWLATTGLATMMFGASGVYTLMLAETTSRVPGAVSLVGGFLVGAQSLASIASNPIIGSVAQRTHTFSSVAIAIGILAIVGGACWVVFARFVRV